MTIIFCSGIIKKQINLIFYNIKMAIYDLSGKNKYYTLYTRIRDDITAGRYATGEKLPAKRALAADLGVSVVTVQLAYEQLLAEGYILSRERSGYYVEKIDVRPHSGEAPEPRRGEQTSPNSQYVLDFVKGSTPAELFPFSVWAKLMRRVILDCGEQLMERVPCAGDGVLKEEISRYLYRSRGITAPPDRIVIGAGAEYLYGVIVQLLGRNRLFAVENPGYGNISSTYMLNGARVAPITVTDAGISIDELKSSGADVVHISPAHQFPTGVITPASTRSHIISWAEEVGGYAVEDDYDSEFRLSGKPLHSLYSLCPGRVIYMNTFSKSLAPSMRLGYMVLPQELMGRFMELFSSVASVVPLFEQRALAEMLRGGYFERHISRLKSHYAGIRRLTLETLKSLGTSCEIFDTGSGPHLLCKFPQAPSDEAIKSGARELGVNVRCLSDYLLAPAAGTERTAVINYSGVMAEQIYALRKKLE